MSAFNDLQPDPEGRIIAGAIRMNMEDPNAEKVPGECYRIELDGSVTELYGGVEASNGIGFSPDGKTLYHSDSTTKGIWVHDVAADGSLSNRRHIGRAAFERGIPDGMCVDENGDLWVAHVGGRRAVKLSPPATCSTRSRCRPSGSPRWRSAGPDWSDMYLVSADNLDDPSKKGGIWRCRPGVAGLPTPLARV